MTRGTSYRCSKKVSSGINLLDKLPVGKTLDIDYILLQNFSNHFYTVSLYSRPENFNIKTNMDISISKPQSIQQEPSKQDTTINELYKPLEGITDSIFKEKSSLKSEAIEPKPILQPKPEIIQSSKKPDILILSVVLKEYETKVFNKENMCCAENEIYIECNTQMFILISGRIV